jgi:[CysO sulfur-carrier protein]-S-L-cysteine hydrolase
MSKLELRQDQLERLLAHVQAEAPNEACGLLVGRGSTVERAYPMENAEHSRSAYRLHPEEQYRVFMDMEESGQEMVAIYHSHPHSPAYPSPRDVNLAFYPEVVYLIVSLMEPGHPVWRAFRIQEGEITEEQVTVVPGDTI